MVNLLKTSLRRILGTLPSALVIALFARAPGWAQEATAPPALTGSARQEAALRARVWREPPIPVEQYDFLNGEKAPDAFALHEVIDCRFVPQKMGGWTPKFLCELPNGDRLKIKYHTAAEANPEVAAEIAASRLLRALGFGADRMYTVKSVRCHGCPEKPFSVLKQLFPKDSDVPFNHGYAPDFSVAREFELVTIERKMEGKPIPDAPAGFDLTELRSPAYAGPRPPVDALNLLIAFLYDSDTTRENQELLCMDSEYQGGPCRKSMVSMGDLGAVLGGGLQSDGHSLNKLDLEQWKQAPLWADEAKCRLEIKGHYRQTFGAPEVSEDGRLFFAGLVRKLSPKQVSDMFRGAKVHEFSDKGESEEKIVARWVKAFYKRIELITKKKKPCPKAANSGGNA